jgi:carotenoid cleavage oxygenase
MPDASLENPYLRGNFAPVADELTVAELAVTGRLPEQLEGRYLRNGPNPVSPPEPGTYHWFTGTGMVHGIRFRGGRAEWYRNRYVRSSEVARTLGEQVRPGPVHNDMDFSANTNVIGHAGRTLALVEAGSLPYELTDELETVGPCDLGGTLSGGYTAHPKRDPASGELHAISYFWGWGNRVQYSVVGTDGLVRKALDVEVGGPVSIHDMSLTETYAVVYDLPVVFSLAAVQEGFAFPYRWDPDYRARVGLLRRESETGEVRWFDAPQCYVFHPLNAYDDGTERVVLDVVRHPKMFFTEIHGPDEGTPTLERWTLDLASGKLLDEQLDDRAQEFPRVDERTVGRRHRYGYVASAFDDWSGVMKHDLQRATSEVRRLHRTGPTLGAAEAVFVPEAPDAPEDHGWLLCIAYDPERDGSDLLVLHAEDVAGDPQAIVHLPQRVPFGFHGNWVPDT